LRRQLFGGRILVLAGVWAASTLGCGGAQSPAECSRPLIDDPVAAEIMAVKLSLEAPPSQAADRLLLGWAMRPGVMGRALMPSAAGATAEFLVFDESPRRLEIRTVDPDPKSRVTVTVDGRRLPSRVMEPRIFIDLPEDLPLGRVALGLHFDPPVDIQDMAVRPTKGGGKIRVVGDGLIQQPTSMFEIVRRVGPGSRLVGEFVAPEGEAPGGRFDLWVEGGAPNRVEHAGCWSNHDGYAGAPPRFDIALPEGLVAVRLVARGRCEPATWKGLTIIEPEREPITVAPLPKPPKLVLLYVLDALRADHVGGKGWTPVLDRLAAEGVAFADHASAAPSTTTAIKSLFSGRFFFKKGGLPSGVETLAEVMRTAGYRTLGISGNGQVSEKFSMTRGFDVFKMVYPLARGADPATYVNRNAADIHRRALELLDGASSDKPTFMYLHSIHPHTPYAPPHELANELCGEIPSTIDGMSETLLAILDQEREISEADRRRLECLYSASIRYNDAEIGTLMKEIGRRFSPDEVLLIVTSDHGEEFFDHGGLLHGHTLYNELLQVPMIVHWPDSLEPNVVDLATDHFDLHETLRALVSAPRSWPGAEGRSLWPLLISGDERAIDSRIRFAAVQTLEGGIFMARSDTRKLVWAPRTGDRWGMGFGPGRTHDPEYFFDLTTDPGEVENLVGSGNLEERWLRSRLRVWTERHSHHDETAIVDLDSETREHLEALGYVQ